MRHPLVHILRAGSAVLLAAATLVTPPQVLAASCNPHRAADNHAYWVGVTDPLSGTRAVYSQIKTYDPYVSGSGFSYAWVMLPGPGSSSWAQIGPYRAASRLTTTIQWNQPGDPAPTQMDLPATTVGSVHTYSVGFAPSTHTFVFYLDGATKASTTLSWAPTSAQVFSEIWQLSSQLMGDASSKESFGSTEIMNSSGSWQWYSGTLSPPTTHFSDSGGPVTFFTWDLCK